MSRTATGSVIFRADACTGTTATWTVKEPTCANPRIYLYGTGDAYQVSDYSDESTEWCDTTASINIYTDATYIGDGSDSSHLSPTYISFEIQGATATITSLNLDSGGWILENISGLPGFGIGFEVRPDAITNATCCLSGEFTYNSGTNGQGNGTFYICIEFNG